MSVNPNKTLTISNIVPRALGFWQSLGTKLYNKNYPDEKVFLDEVSETDVIDGELSFDVDKLLAIKDIPTFSRAADQAYFAGEKRKQKTKEHMKNTI